MSCALKMRPRKLRAGWTGEGTRPHAFGFLFILKLDLRDCFIPL